MPLTGQGIVLAAPGGHSLKTTVHSGRSVIGRVIELLPFTATDANDDSDQVMR